MARRVIFRGMLVLGAAAGLTAFSSTAQAVIVGIAPDSPANHVDPNVTTSRFGGVGSLDSSIQGRIGTAVVIDSTHILTAAHVAQKDPTPLTYTFNLNYSGAFSSKIAVTAAAVSSAYSGTQGGHGDIAVLTLASPIPTGVPTYPLYAGAVPLGTQLTLVGYGDTGDGVSGKTADGTSDVKRWGKNVLDAHNPTYSDLYEYDFDGGSAPNFLGGATLGNATEVTLGAGDSGGPAFVDVGGQLEIAAINTTVGHFSTSYMEPLFGSGGGGTLVNDYTSWIQGIAPGTAVPEPASLGLLACGLGLACLRRRRK